MNTLEKVAIGAIAGTALFVAAVTGAYMHGVSTTTDHFQGVIAKNNADNATEATRLVNAARNEEKSKADKFAAIDAKSLKEKNDEITSRDAVIAGLRAGTTRLQQRFTCPASAEHLSSTATSTGQRDAASTGGLQADDAEFLIRESSRADQAVKQLQACQAVVRADRGQ